MGKNEQTKQGSITHEIMIEIGRIVFPIFAIIAILVTVVFAIEIKSANQKELTLQSESAAWEIADFFDQYERAVNLLAVSPQVIDLLKETSTGDNILKSSQYQTVYENMGNIANTDTDNVLSVWIADIDANVLTQSDGFTSADGWDITSRPWYSCIGAKKTILTEPYVDSSTGMMILSAVAPIYDESGTALGAVGLDISMEHVSEVIKEYKIGNSGYAILLSNEGMVLYHKNPALILKNVKEINTSANVLNAVSNNTSNFMHFKISGESRYGFSAPISTTGYMVLSALPGFEFYSKLIICMILLVVVFSIAIVLIVLGIRKTAAEITEPVKALHKAAQSLAEGDLDVELHIDVDNEIGELGHSISQTVDRLKEYIVYIDEISDVLGKFTC